MTTIPTDTIRSLGIRAAATEAGLHEVRCLGRYEHPAHPGSNDWAITLYDLGTGADTCRVAATNSDPVWEESDVGAFAALLAEYEVPAE